MRSYKNYVWIGVLLMVVACGEEKKKQEPKEKEKLPEVESTAYEYTFDEKSIPAGFAMDKMVVEDTIKRVKISVQYIKETGENFDFTEKLIEALIAQTQKDLSFYEIPADESQTSEVTYGIEDFSAGQQYISVRYVVDSYTQGGAHHNYRWYSLTYSRDEKRMYWLRDIFLLKTRADSLAFIQLVGSHLDRPMELSVPFDSVDVFVRNDTDFLIAPQLGWAEGMRTATLTDKKLWNFFYQRWK